MKARRVKSIDLINKTITFGGFEDIPADIYKAEALVVIPAADYDAQQAAIAAAIEILDSLEEISTESWAGIAAGCWIDMSEIRKALAQLRAVKEEADDA